MNAAAPWYACEQPERPTDPLVVWHYTDCQACRLKVELLDRLYPDDPHIKWLILCVAGEAP